MVSTITAQEIMTQNYKKINPEETLATAITMFDDETDILLIFEEKNGEEEYLGSITEYQILRSGLNKQETKVRKLMIKTPRLNPDDQGTKIARLMLENDTYSLPVFEKKNNKEKIIGIVTVDKLLLRAIEKEYGKITAQEAMSPITLITTPDENLHKIINFFREHHVTRAPVMSNNKLIGVIRMHDIIMKVLSLDLDPGYEALPRHELLKTIKVDAIISYDYITTRPTTPLKKAIRELFNEEEDNIAKKNATEIIITNEEETEVMGIITKRDLLEMILTTEPKTEPIKIELSQKIKNFKKETVINEYERFAERFSKTIGSGRLYAHYQEETSYLIEAKVRLLTDKIKLYLKERGPDEITVTKRIIKKLKEEIDKIKIKNK